VKPIPPLTAETATLVRQMIATGYSDGRIAYMLQDRVYSWSQVKNIRLMDKAAEDLTFPGLDPKLNRIKRWQPCAIEVGPEGVIVDVELTGARLR